MQWLVILLVAALIIAAIGVVITALKWLLIIAVLIAFVAVVLGMVPGKKPNDR